MNLPIRLPVRSTASKAGLATVVAVLGSAGIYATLAPKPAAAIDHAAAMPAATAAALVQATSGRASSQLQAFGEDAKAINAALPFSASPVPAARPFLVSGNAVNEQRALDCLSQAVYYEAGFEPLEGRRAVAQVVLNRLRHPAFPNSVCGVVYQRSTSGVCQFTFVCDGALYRAPEAGAWRQARATAQAALMGHVERSVGVATHYHADYVAPRWAPLLAKVSQIGAHIFYRWPGAWGRPQAFAGRYIGEPSDPSALRPPPLHALAEGTVASTVAATAGPPVRRAPNDVGGLLETSKGWKLTIPDPRDASSIAARVIADQQASARAVPARMAVASAAAPLPAVREGLE